MIRLKTALFASALMLGTSGIAHAGFADGDSYQFQVWNGTYSALGLSGTPESASQATLSNLPNVLPTVSFRYTGPIDFAVDGPQTGPNLVRTFFGSYQTDISNFDQISGTIPSETEFLGTTLSSTYTTTGNTLNSNAIVTFMEITGTYSAQAGTILTISHDDGASLYIGSNSTPIISSGNPTSKISSSATLAAATNNLFTLVYVEANGAPSVLQISETLPVPEPGSFAVLGTGLLGLVLIRARRRKG